MRFTTLPKPLSALMQAPSVGGSIALMGILQSTYVSLGYNVKNIVKVVSRERQDRKGAKLILGGASKRGNQQ